MHLQLDGTGSIVSQLVRALRATIASGSLPPGSALPPTRQLAAEYGFSRSTIVAAYEQMQAEGLLTAHVGAGTRVAEHKASGAQNMRQGTPGSRRFCAPPSTYAARLRSCCDYRAVPGRRPPDVRVAFLYGEPMAHPLLASAWHRELVRASAYCRTGYPSAPGLHELRTQVCTYLDRYRGIHAQPDDVVIVGGTQQALALTARVLLDVGDRAIIEDPHYYATRTVLETHGARVDALPVDSDGLQCDRLPERGARLICLTPAHQFPTGAVLSQPRRHQILQYAERHDGWIFEDDYDSEFRVRNRSVAALRSLDHGDRVVYAGTFSKTLFPALRLGYLIAPAPLREDFIAAKFLDDMGSPALEQLALANFMANGGFERHLRRNGKLLRQRRVRLLDGLQRLSRGRLDIVQSSSGMHVVVWLNVGDSATGRRLIELAHERGLGLFPIDVCYQSPPRRAGLLMGYGALSNTEISEGLAILEVCLDQVSREGPAVVRQLSENDKTPA
ncbi:MocR-like pyridoxine biosynthesis transcription factor PdxR [Dokdonella immobilis]|uniref:GntR family transcriptional regulator / MocR family aminotransferase n=1 Tax=Dokdonella immobilis TaxID=578942 RepID=A0A1I4XI58_9GAMM|nr:PLP-dependent aminotransferase family protein [Dokdonella immobilis]SFN25286.1 GntR family transcriptional regulator / MocR family aminotransferase [Dokdonella immobilis]